MATVDGITLSTKDFGAGMKSNIDMTQRAMGDRYITTGIGFRLHYEEYQDVYIQ